MHNSLAIHLDDVSKIYKLHGSQSDQLIDVLGLQRFGFKTKTPVKEFAALSNLSLDVPRGHRIGIVGRNGAGKTTLLKLICGNFAPTSGKVEVNGTVQALMNVGLGFHPEYTGRENVEAALQYNGLAIDEYKNAFQGIVDFCELEEFLDQPFKTYSLGMQARLMFAAATAIKPDILIVDEVLGAGDAYFVAKSKARVEKLVSTGCTMLLVSHSMQQVLELCNEVIWIDKGQIRMRGEAFKVVKAYEEWINGPIATLVGKDGEKGAGNLLISPTRAANDNDNDETSINEEERIDKTIINAWQSPYFMPHEAKPKFSSSSFPLEFENLAKGGISRWMSNQGLKLLAFRIVSEDFDTSKIFILRPLCFRMVIVAEDSGQFNCRYAILFYNQNGSCVARIISSLDSFSIKSGERRNIEMILNPNQLGPGEYTLSVSIHKFDKLELLNSTERYDLLNRSFTMQIEIPESLNTISANFFHSSEWNFGC
jgi:lipopolysaccharide transport system ATP-binding protein